MKSRVELTPGLAIDFACRYDELELSDRERWLFDVVSHRVSEANRYDKEDFLSVCEWKSVRTKSLVRTNSPEAIAEATTIAFTSPLWLQVPILCALRGVSVPTASALLTIWNPNQYTVYDFRVRNSLGLLTHARLEGVDIDLVCSSYQTYLRLARDLAGDLTCSLRTLDKALWMYDKLRNAN